MNKMKISDIEEIFERILEKLRFECEEEIEISSDLYRFIPTSEWANFQKNEILVGSLEDDVQCLKLLAKDKDHPCMYVDFDRMASLLRAISQEYNPPM
ncbi:MAG: hypothetical protein AAGG68_10100 [Bacteroidota bacterium]